jgi:hypothetical protein
MIASQLLTLMTTPVVYVYLSRLRRRRDEPSSTRRRHGQAIKAGLPA